jgi:hypothetical protein
MNDDYGKFEELKRADRLDTFEAAAERLGTNAQSIEKDYLVCQTIDAMFKGLGARPKLYFKGGTSLSKGYGLIKRFSEDIDIVISRAGLGIKSEDDPLREGLSRNKIKEAAAKAKEKCSSHVLDRMQKKLSELMPTCEFEEDDSDNDKCSLKVKYPSLMDADGYLKPWVKIECGARGAIEPEVQKRIEPYIQTELGKKFDLTVEKVTLISAGRTFWEKALILHGIYCGFRDKGRRPGEKNLISRHYYDVAMMCDSAEGRKAVKNLALLTKCRNHKLALFRNSWEKLEEAEPGKFHLVPQKEILKDLTDDYAAMTGMMFGDAPEFDWIIEQLEKLEKTINKAK